MQAERHCVYFRVAALFGCPPPVLCANVIGATSSESALVSVRLSVFHASHPAAPEIAAPSRKPLRRVAVFSYCESVKPDSLLLLLSMSVSTFIFFVLHFLVVVSVR